MKNKIKSYINNLKYSIKRLKFIKSLWSPFKPFRLKWYVGETQVGVPYFLPRKWVKFTKKDAYEAALKSVNDKTSVYYGKDPNEVSLRYRNYTKAVPRKIGFDFCSMGWKTKWEETDYRFEWSPVLSFVFFGYQIAVTAVVDNPDAYWTAWLYYEKDTDKTKSKRERIEQCKKEFLITSTIYEKDKEPVTVNYYETVLRKKYL